MRSYLLPVLALCGLAVTSCGSDPRSLGQSTIQFVRSVLGDSESPEYKILKSYDPFNCDGSIYVLGDTVSCYRSASSLYDSDGRDNIDGIEGPDGLPDFSGETIAAVYDVANGMYDSLFLKGKESLLREITVRNVLKCVDTMCYVSPYDMEGLGKKSMAKLIVLASPSMAVDGVFDVDSLLTASSCRLPVISPVNILAGEIAKGGSTNVGVITTKLRADSGMYPILFGKAAASNGMTMTCFAASVENSENALVSFLDKYIQSGYVNPLDAIMVDDPSCSVENMKAELERILSVMYEESLEYSDFISRDVKIVEPSSVLRRECYRILRERNLFTHKIAYPVTESYLIVSRNRSRDLDTDILIEYNNRYIPR